MSSEALSTVTAINKTEEINVYPNRSESKVLVIYTGGTIGMVRNEQRVFVPAHNALSAWLRKNPTLHDEDYATERCLTYLVLPECQEKTRILYSVYEFNPLLDSSNMGIKHWTFIARNIRELYEKYDGFVILHGTDTLSYTASALSFMFENLGKTVIITGSQIPIYETRSDGRDNLLGALILAGNYNIPEVTVFFSNKLFRGNRTTKVCSSSLNAFDSPNFPPIATVHIDVEVDYRLIFRQCNIEKFTVHSSLNTNVGLLRIFPSITHTTVQSFLKQPILGVVLQTYGAGNVPSNRKDIISEIKAATLRGVLVVNITQCLKGGVSDVYETGQALLNVGVIPGYDMTPEAALTKLSYVLSKSDWDHEMKRKMMKINIRGELSSGGKVSNYSEWDLVDAVARSLHVHSQKEQEQLGNILYPAMISSAVKEGNIEKLESLKTYGAHLSIADSDYRTPLHVACCEGKMEVVEHLLLNGASVHAKDRYDRTPLLDAIRFDHHAVIKLLMRCGAHLVGNPRKIGEELCSAAAQGMVQRLRSYQYAGADLNQPDVSERTALHMAALHNQIDCVLFLLLADTSTEAVDLLGQTPLDIAQKMMHKHVQDILQFAKRSSQEDEEDDLIFTT